MNTDSNTPIPTEDVIEDAVNEAQMEPLEDLDASTDTEPIAADELEATDSGAVAATETPIAESSGSKESNPDEDFSKKYGIPSRSVTGKENKIPYSRVRKIVEKAQREAKEAALKEAAGAPQPKLQEYETKIKTYEQRLQGVDQFAHILENDPPTFLKLLSEHPAYKEFFQFIGQVAQGVYGQQQQQAPVDEMPGPDQQLPDGTAIYSMEGLKKRDAWLAKQIESKISQRYEGELAKVNQRLTPFEQREAQQAHIQQLIPQINQQIAEARTWPQFTENEPEIVKALQENPQLSLEGAYRQVVLPKLIPARDTMRQQLLQEIKKTPAATSAPTRAIKPARPASNGPRSTEDIIREALEQAGLG